MNVRVRSLSNAAQLTVHTMLVLTSIGPSSAHFRRALHSNPMQPGLIELTAPDARTLFSLKCRLGTASINGVRPNFTRSRCDGILVRYGR